MNVEGTLAINIGLLMTKEGLSFPDIDKMKRSGRSDISGRYLREVVSGSKSPTAEKLEALAKILRVDPWQLLWEDLPDAVIHPKEVSKLMKHYLGSTLEGRQHIIRTAEFSPKKDS